MFIKIHNYLTKYCDLSIFAYSMRSLYYKINNDLKIRLSDHYANACNHNSYITILVNEDRFTVFEAGNILYDVNTYPKLRKYLSYKIKREKPGYSSADAIKTILGKEEIFDRNKLSSAQNNSLNKAIKEDREDVSQIYAQYIVQNNKINTKSVDTSKIAVKPIVSKAAVKPLYSLNESKHTITVYGNTYQIKAKKWPKLIEALKNWDSSDLVQIGDIIKCHIV